MSILEDIEREVELRVAEQLLPRVLDMLETTHAKHGHSTGCKCSYCLLKRRATADIGYIRPHLRDDRISGTFGDDFIEVQSVFNTKDERQMSELTRLLNVINNDADVEQFSKTVTLDGFIVVHVKRRRRNKRYDFDEMHFRIKGLRERLADRWRVQLREEKIK